jgi:hypothetical protein
MNDQHTEPAAETERASLADLLTFIAQGCEAGLPVPAKVRGSGTTFELAFNSHDAPTPWAARFNVNDDDLRYSRNAQPYPLDAEYDRWTTMRWFNWNGWRITLDTEEPITEAQVREWVDSGRAASRAAFVARTAAEAAKAGETA